MAPEASHGDLQLHFLSWLMFINRRFRQTSLTQDGEEEKSWDEMRSLYLNAREASDTKPPSSSRSCWEWFPCLRRPDPAKWSDTYSGGPISLALLLATGATFCFANSLRGVWWWWQATTGVLYAAALALLYLVQQTDPGVIPPGDEPDPIVTGLGEGAALLPQPVEWSKDVRGTWMRWNAGQGSFDKYCRVCRIWRDQRDSHCQFCGCCVAHWDHHCGVLGTCIGGRNHRSVPLQLVAVAFGQPGCRRDARGRLLFQVLCGLSVRI